MTQNASELRLDEDDRNAQLLLKRVQVLLGALLRLAGVDNDLGRGGGHGLAVQVVLGAEHRAEHRIVGELLTEDLQLVVVELLGQAHHFVGAMVSSTCWAVKPDGQILSI